MHQPLSDESLTLPTNSVRALNPTLRRALGVLDARLEDELARYRRYRAGLGVAPSSVTAFQRSRTPVSLQLPTPMADSANAADTPSDSAIPAVVLDAVNDTDEDEDITVNQTPAPSPDSPVTPPLPPRTPLSFQNDLPEDASSALVLAAAQADSEANSDPDELIGVGDLPQGGFLTDSSFAADSASAPNDYLESSEELLRSLAEEEANVAAERNVLEGLLTPFGVGSMLLMLLGSGMFGYLIMNPASLTAVKDLAGKIATFRSRPNQPSTQVASIDVDGGTTKDVGWLSNSPALDSNEFRNLSLGNISALRTRAGGSLSLVPQSGQSGASSTTAGGSPLSQLDGKTAPKSSGKPQAQSSTKQSKVLITGLTPVNVKPIAPPAPTITRKPATKSSSGGLFSGKPVRISPAPQPAARQTWVAPKPAPKPAPTYSKPRRPARSYEPPAPSYQPPAPVSRSPKPAPVKPPAPQPVNSPAPVVPPPPVNPVKPAPVRQPAPVVVPEPKGDYRVVTPYTNDAALEAAQKSSSDASFRNLDDGAYVQYGGSYNTKSEADARAAELRQKGVEVEVK